METSNDAKSIASQIMEGTKEAVEAQGSEYSYTFESDEEEIAPSDEERNELTDRVVKQIKKGAKDELKMQKILEKYNK